MKVNTAIITAAGFGTRFLPIVKEIPKEMLPIVDKPIIQYVVEECLDAGIEKIIIVVREGNNVIKNYFNKSVPEVRDLLASVGKEKRFQEVERLMTYEGIEIITQRTDLPYGNGSPVLSAMPYIEKDRPFAVLFADDLILSRGKSGIAQLLEYFENSDVDGVISAQSVEHSKVNKYGIIKAKDVIDDHHGQVDFIVEKPEPENAPSDLVTYGRYVLPYRAMDLLAEVHTGLDNELWLPDVNHQIAQTGKLMYKVIDGDWYTTGDPSNYFEALTRFYLANDEYKDKVKSFLENL
ncbi:MAG TPA: sugar phosphate nucleotidyltransferase [Candidatus Dojkabacteria bacterium]|nr:sugar phosphate nucleotidyltransferase [Candidatus Dojkabacteria bacterium]HRP51748.1 sugar phosphate nucleotidyltransferase [Candidatus Dojkabacteria bacterium]